MTKISVVIPAYNCADSIRQTIQSIFRSGITDYEILIVDDGSTDGTGQICDRFTEENGSIRCIHQQNAGVSSARNRGIREASGEYIWFVDADDSIKEESLLQAEEILQKQAPDMLVFGIEFDYYHRGELYRKEKILPPMEGILAFPECNKRLYELFSSNSLSSLCNRIIKRSVVFSMDTHLREDMFLYEDLEFVLRLLPHCSSLYIYRDVVYQYKQSEDEGNAGRRLARIPHIPDLLSKIETVLESEPDRDRILLKLYLTLAREKINVSSADEINTICSDFHDWIDAHDMQRTISQGSYPMMLYQGQTAKLILKRTYSMLRHKTANLVKQTIGDFRKW